MRKLFIIPVLVFVSVLFTACSDIVGPTSLIDGYVAYDFVIPKDKRELAVKMVQDIVLAANPKSDEEPEDYIAEARRTVRRLLGDRKVGMKIRSNGDWVFIPYEELNTPQKATVDEWLKYGH